jgi:hypothetical protein
MIEKLKEFLQELKESKEFKQFKEKNALAYNTSFFLVDKQLFVYFYDPNSDKITSFIKQNNEIVSQEDEIFRKEKSEIKELQLDKVKISLKDAEGIIEKKYQDEATKKMFILQQTEFPIWNITYLTTKLDILNVKINAISGEILEEKIESALNLQK